MEPTTIPYSPTVGDVIEWGDALFYVIEITGENLGVVIPVGQSHVVRNFQFILEGMSSKFVRKMSEAELVSTGLKEEEELTEPPIAPPVKPSNRRYRINTKLVLVHNDWDVSRKPDALLLNKLARNIRFLILEDDTVIPMDQVDENMNKSIDNNRILFLDGTYLSFEDIHKVIIEVSEDTDSTDVNYISYWLNP